MPSQFELLDRRERIRCVGTTVLRCTAMLGLMLAAYVTAPGRLTASSGTFVRVVVELILIATAILLAVRSVWRAKFPVLRAIETLTVVISVVIVGFASVYLLTSGNDVNAFNEPLDHTGALYFSMTTSTTVGFGDINPVSDAARIVVMIHMLTNVVVVGVVARVLLGTAKRRAQPG